MQGIVFNAAYLVLCWSGRPSTRPRTGAHRAVIEEGVMVLTVVMGISIHLEDS